MPPTGRKLNPVNSSKRMFLANQRLIMFKNQETSVCSNLRAKPLHSRAKERERKSPEQSFSSNQHNETANKKGIERQKHLLGAQPGTHRCCKIKKMHSNYWAAPIYLPGNKTSIPTTTTSTRRPETAPSRRSSGEVEIQFHHSGQDSFLTRLEKCESIRNKMAAKASRRAEIYAINRVLREVFEADLASQMKKIET